MPLEMLEQLRKEGWDVKLGDIGENITTIGIPYEQFNIGDKYKFGEVIIEITEQATPCYKLGLIVGKEKYCLVEIFNT